MERDLRPPADLDHVHVVDLADARNLERRGLHPLAQGRLRAGLRLDVDDDVGLGKRAAHGVLDLVGRGMALCDGGSRRDADHDVDEVPARRLPESQPAQADARDVALDRLARGRGRLRRGQVHQHVDVAAHQARRCDEHDHGDDERRDRVGVRISGTREREPDSTATDPTRSLAKWSALDCSAALEYRLAARHETTARRDVDQDHDADDDERVPGRVDLRRARAGQPRHGAPDDHAGRERRGRSPPRAPTGARLSRVRSGAPGRRVAPSSRRRRRSAARRPGRCPSAAPRR